MADATRRVSVRLSLDDAARVKAGLREVGETGQRSLDQIKGGAERASRSLDLLDVATGRLKDYLPAQPVRLWDRYACVPMYVDRVPAGKPRAGETFAYSHDDTDSLQHKAAYVRDRGLGGVMTWEADGEPRDHRLTAALARGLKGQVPAAACIAGGTDTIQ